MPTVVEKIVNPDGEIAYQFKPKISSRLNASPKTLEAVRRACRGVVHEGVGPEPRPDLPLSTWGARPEPLRWSL